MRTLMLLILAVAMLNGLMKLASAIPADGAQNRIDARIEAMSE